MADSLNFNNPLSPPSDKNTEIPPKAPEAVEFLPNNPGTLEEIHKKCSEVFPQTFEGGKFSLSKALSNHLQVTHNISLSGSQQIPSGYRFNATAIGDILNNVDVSHVMVADIGPAGDLNANLVYRWSPYVRSKFMGQMENQKFQASQFTTDWKGENSSTSVTFANADIFSQSGMGIFHYLQKVSKRVSLGAELATQFGPQVPGYKAGMLCLSARYEGRSGGTLSGSLGSSSGLRLCYHQQCSENLQVAAELETSSRLSPEATASIGYAVEIPKAFSSFKGKIDTNGVVSMVIEKKLDPLPFTLSLCGAHSFTHNKFKAGIGFVIG